MRHATYGMSLQSLDIIVLEDSKTMQVILRSMLASFGVRRIRMYESGEEALKAILAEPPNLLILDWRTRSMSGYQLLKTIRLKEFYPVCLIPVMMITAHGTRALAEKAIRAGAQSFLVKPIAPRMLMERINWVLQDDRELVLHDDRYIIDGMLDMLSEASERMIALDQIRMMHEEHLRKVEQEKKARQAEVETAQKARYPRQWISRNDVA